MQQKATDEQILAALAEHGGIRARAARALGYSTRALMSRLDKMAGNGVEIPASSYDGTVTGKSTLLGPDGQVKLQWVKEKAGPVNPEKWAEIVKDVFTGTERVKAIPPPKVAMKDLLVVYPIGDHHTAMYASADEAGDDYDIGIAKRLLTSSIAYLVDRAPPSESAVIVNVGDFFHVDQHRPETTRSHNALDVDTRYSKMIHAGVAMMRTCIDSALAKHKRVRVINACGNHDDVGALWLSLSLALLYEKNPRVTIDTNPSKFAYVRHGQVLLGVTHGDTVKLDDLGGIMSADEPALWGETKHRYWLTGHIHQRRTIELRGCMVESFRTLAAKDAWAAGRGYRSGRDMTSITFHRDHGELGRHTFNVSMLEAA